jgi:hypothetical protein
MSARGLVQRRGDDLARGQSAAQKQARTDGVCTPPTITPINTSWRVTRMTRSTRNEVRVVLHTHTAIGWAKHISRLLRSDGAPRGRVVVNAGAERSRSALGQDRVCVCVQLCMCVSVCL